MLESASSTASTTGPVADPPAEEPKEEPFVLQPAVTLHVEGSSINADIELENLTCKSCEKVLPAAQVKAYYTPWYPNDGDDEGSWRACRRAGNGGIRCGALVITLNDVVRGGYCAWPLLLRGCCRSRERDRRVPDATDGVCDLARPPGQTIAGTLPAAYSAPMALG